MQNLISRKDAAEILGISVKTLDQARLNGLIAYILASRINRFLTARRTVHSCRKNSVRLWHDAFQPPKFRNVLEKWQKSIEIT